MDPGRPLPHRTPLNFHSLSEKIKLAVSQQTRIDVTTEGAKMTYTSVPDEELSEATALVGPLTTLRAVDFPHLDKLLRTLGATLSLIHITKSANFQSPNPEKGGSLFPKLYMVPEGARCTPKTPEEPPSIGPLADTGRLHPNLTNFRFEAPKLEVTSTFGDDLLEFLRNCPQLEQAFIIYGDPKELIMIETVWVVTLAHLHSFTLETPDNRLPIGLLNKLSLPHTCAVTLTIRGTGLYIAVKPWMYGFFPTLPSLSPHELPDVILSHLSDAEAVKIFVRAETDSPPGHRAIVGATFSNGEYEVSLNRLVNPSAYPHSAEKQVKNILSFLKRSNIGLYVKTLHFQHHPDGPAVRLRVILKWVKKFVESQKRRETPLNTLFLEVRNVEELKGCGGLIGRLGVRVEFVQGHGLYNIGLVD